MVRFIILALNAAADITNCVQFAYGSVVQACRLKD